MASSNRFTMQGLKSALLLCLASTTTIVGQTLLIEIPDDQNYSLPAKSQSRSLRTMSAGAKEQHDMALEMVKSGGLYGSGCPSLKPDDVSGFHTEQRPEFDELQLRVAPILAGSDTSQDKMKAPYCKLGQDCFEDVNHKRLALDMKKLALTVNKYLSERKSSTSTSRGVEYRVDAILTELTDTVGALHRAVMRNWHMSQLVLENLVASKAASEETTTVKNRRVYRTLKFNYQRPIQCEAKVKGVKGQLNTPPECKMGIDWHEDKHCLSPLTKPKSQCLPTEVSQFFEEVHGHQAFVIGKAGNWEYQVKVTVLANHTNGIDKDVILGSLDKIAAKDKALVHLATINNIIDFNTDSKAKGVKHGISIDGRAEFEAEDRILLRLAQPKEDLVVQFKLRLGDQVVSKTIPTTTSESITESTMSRSVLNESKSSHSKTEEKVKSHVKQTKRRHHHKKS